MPGEATIKLTIPRQDLAEFTHFRPNGEGAREWLRALPVNNTLGNAQLLGVVLADLNRVRLAPEARHEVLEQLRPSLDLAATNLAKRYLNQPLVMPAEPRRWAELNDQLLTLCASAYTIVAVEAIRHRDSIRQTNPARLACQAIHRALTCCGRKVLQAFQLYRPLRMHGWQVLHQLYALAESQGLADLPVPEPFSGAATIRNAYLQCMLLSCCKPNQLRQGDLAILHAALSQWGGLVELRPATAGRGLFIVDLDSDQPPLYSALYEGSPTGACRYLNTAPLIERVYAMKAALDNRAAGESADLLPSHLLDHIIASLANMSQRNFKRQPSDQPLRVCLGLSSTHYHVAGRRSFEQLLHGNTHVPGGAAAQGNPFLQPGRGAGDPAAGELVRNEWLPGQVVIGDVQRLEQGGEVEEVQVDLPVDQRFPIHKVPLTDASPGGYCLDWTDSLPGDVRTGDIVGLKEEQNRDWVIAVIRWLSRMEHERTVIGLELLSPRAIAYGALIHRARGSKTPPMRVLLLPEIKLVGQPNTLITPRANFRERQRVTLVSGPETRTVQLQRQISATASYSQFEFNYIEELGDVLSRGQHDPLGSQYDSLWSNI